jgi:hypothetical protein
MCHQWSSTCRYIQDTTNNQQRIMAEKLCTKHSETNSTLYEPPYVRKQYINQNIMRITQTKLCTLISSQNTEFDRHLFSPRRNRNNGTWFQAQCRKIYKIMSRRPNSSVRKLPSAAWTLTCTIPGAQVKPTATTVQVAQLYSTYAKNLC